jgi:hypothetical protein
VGETLGEISAAQKMEAEVHPSYSDCEANDGIQKLRQCRSTIETIETRRPGKQ